MPLAPACGTLAPVPQYNPSDGVGPVQAGLPGVLPEEAPLTSEVALDGGILSARRREALAQLRSLLIDRHPDVDPDEWRVFVATVAPPYGHLPRAPGTPARALGAMQAARDCFPGLSPSAALRRFREVQATPKVRGLIADFRSLELADLADQRGLVREALHATITRGTQALYLLDPAANPNEWSKVSACVVAATKVLVEMDGLSQSESVDVATAVVDGNGGDDDADGATLAAKVSRVAADLRARVLVPVE